MHPKKATAPRCKPLELHNEPDYPLQHILPLREAGLNDGEILDLIQAVAIFAWANRLMLNLGEPVFEADSTTQ